MYIRDIVVGDYVGLENYQDSIFDRYINVCIVISVNYEDNYLIVYELGSISKLQEINKNNFIKIKNWIPISYDRQIDIDNKIKNTKEYKILQKYFRAEKLKDIFDDFN